LVIFGATGFTGKLVAEYLSISAPPTLRWAVAGRNTKKLEALVASFPISQNNDKPKVGIIVADSTDDDTLKSMVMKTRVLVTTSGPYILLGLPLLGYCAAAGTHYADLSGEFFFHATAIKDFDLKAKETGAKILLASGYDSVPFDLGVELLREELDKMKLNHKKSKHSILPETTTTRVSSLVTKMHGWASGGTIASSMIVFYQVVASLMNPELRENGISMKDAMNPYLLIPELSKYSNVSKGCILVDSETTGWGSLPRWDTNLGDAGIPHFMAYVNSRIVRRSQFLNRPGHRISYKEGMSIWCIFDALYWSLPYFFRGDVSLSPAQGEGPNKNMRDEGGFEVRFVAEEIDHYSKERDNAIVKGPIEILATGNGDPGYRFTSIILAQVGMCLADTNCHRLGSTSGRMNGGVMTVVAGLEASVLRERLEGVKVKGESLLKYEIVKRTKENEEL